MKVGAVEGEVGGGAEITAEKVEVCDGSSDDHSECDGTSDAWESGTLKSVGSEGMGEGIHE